MSCEGYTLSDDYLSISFEGMKEVRKKIISSIDAKKAQRENISKAIESLQVPDSILRGYGNDLIHFKNSISKDIDELMKMSSHIDYVMRRFEEVDNEYAARFKSANYGIQEKLGLHRASAILGGCTAGLTSLVSQVTKSSGGKNNAIDKKAAKLTYSSINNKNTGKLLLVTDKGKITAQAKKMYVSQNSSATTKTASKDNKDKPATADAVKLSNIESCLKALGFTISKDKATHDVEVYSALIIVQWYLGAEIDGKLDNKKTLEELKKLYGKGTRAKEILDNANKNWNPEEPTIKKVDKNNGWLSEGGMTRVSGTEFLEVNTATAWAMMVQGAIKYNETTKSKKLNISSFGLDTGYRSYKDQVRMEALEKYGGGNLAANPNFYSKNASSYMKKNYSKIINGTLPDSVYKKTEKDGKVVVGELSGYGSSKHGWGIAVDFRTSDPGGKEGKLYKDNGKAIYGTGVATKEEVKWLAKNAGKYGFEGYYYDKSKGYFRETWHWNYTGKTKK